MMKIKDVKALRQKQTQLQQSFDPQKKLVTICAGTGCRGYGCVRVKEKLEAEILKQKLDVEVRATGCFGFCEKGPLVVVHPQKIFYQQVKYKHRIVQVRSRGVAPKRRLLLRVNGYGYTLLE